MLPGRTKRQLDNIFKFSDDWSEEARRKALETRRRNARPQEKQGPGRTKESEEKNSNNRFIKEINKTLKTIPVQNFISDKTEKVVQNTINILNNKGDNGSISNLGSFIERESNLYQKAMLRNPDLKYRKRLGDEFNTNVLRKCEYSLKNK